jgi:purine-binding chemotaxis protein CheW
LKGWSVSESPSRAGLHLIVNVQSLACALPIARVIETMRPLPVQHIDGAPEVVLGAAIIRGLPTPVVDASRLLGAAGSARPGRFVILGLDERRVALAVTAVQGVRVLGQESFTALPPLLAQADSQAVAAIGALDQELVVLLGGVRMVPDSVFAALPEGAPA